MNTPTTHEDEVYPIGCADCGCCSTCVGPDADCPWCDRIGDSTCPCTCG